jgi:hypothetical protein
MTGPQGRVPPRPGVMGPIAGGSLAAKLPVHTSLTVGA